MKYVPMGLTRSVSRQLLKLDKHSPTIMVVTGVVGLGVTAVLAAKATRKIEPILDQHKQARYEIGLTAHPTHRRQQQKELVKLYGKTGIELGRLYAPTLVVGTLSAGSVLYGHKILQGRHIATMAAYSGLMEQYQAYRARVAETLGADMERDIHDGAVGKWKEDPDHKGEFQLASEFGDNPESYLRPFFDESNANWTRDPASNFYFLKGVQNHMNNILMSRGHLFLSEVYDALGMSRPRESIVAGWLYDGDRGDGFVDFGFLSAQDPQTIAFRNHAERSVRLNFNIDGVIWNLI